MTQTKNGYPGLPRWGLCLELTAPPHKTTLLRKLQKGIQSPPKAVVMMVTMMMTMTIIINVQNQGKLDCVYSPVHSFSVSLQVLRPYRNLETV